MEREIADALQVIVTILTVGVITIFMGLLCIAHNVRRIADNGDKKEDDDTGHK